MLPEYKGGTGAAEVHQVSGDILEKTVLKEAAIGGNNVVIPMVGKTAEKIKGIIEFMNGKGYTVNLHLSEISPETSIARASERAQKTGRVVPESYIKEVGTKPTQTFDEIISDPKYNQMLNEKNKFSNEVPKGMSPKVVETSSPSYVFVSPNVKTGLTYDDAVLALKSNEQKTASKIIQETINKDKTPGNVIDAAGVWTDGAENTIVFEDGNLSKEYLRTKASEWGKQLNQKQTIWFRSDKMGNDYVGKLFVDGKSKEVMELLKQNGIQYMTVGKDTIFLFNKSGEFFNTEMFKKVADVIKQSSLDTKKVKWQKGEGDFIGSWLEGEQARSEAQKIYQQIIDSGGV